MKTILIIEDDAALLETIRTSLEVENFKVFCALDGEEGISLAREKAFDLICADIVLPGKGGLEICRALREENIKTPIVFMTGEKKEEIDKVLGLELGGDDYILKPFGIRELLARIRAVLRRTCAPIDEPVSFSFSDIVVDFKKQEIQCPDRTITITSKEAGILKLLIKREGEVVSREDILNEVWGYETYPTTRTVDTFIHNLRKKIEVNPSNPQHLITIPWSGYKFKK
ncbi:MAG: response regulator transcription factor [Acidobacteriota bacterium]